MGGKGVVAQGHAMHRALPTGRQSGFQQVISRRDHHHPCAGQGGGDFTFGGGDGLAAAQSTDVG